MPRINISSTLDAGTITIRNHEFTTLNTDDIVSNVIISTFDVSNQATLTNVTGTFKNVLTVQTLIFNNCSLTEVPLGVFTLSNTAGTSQHSEIQIQTYDSPISVIPSYSLLNLQQRISPSVTFLEIDVSGRDQRFVIEANAFTARADVNYQVYLVLSNFTAQPDAFHQFENDQYSYLTLTSFSAEANAFRGLSSEIVAIEE